MQTASTASPVTGSRMFPAVPCPPRAIFHLSRLFDALAPARRTSVERCDALVRQDASGAVAQSEACWSGSVVDVVLVEVEVGATGCVVLATGADVVVAVLDVVLVGWAVVLDVDDDVVVVVDAAVVDVGEGGDVVVEVLVLVG